MNYSINNQYEIIVEDDYVSHESREIAFSRMIDAREAGDISSSIGDDQATVDMLLEEQHERITKFLSTHEPSW